MKNDRKIVLILFGFELFMLAVLMVIATFRVPGVSLPTTNAKASNRYFTGSLYLNHFATQSKSFIQAPVSQEESAYLYYTFSLTKDGGVATQRHDSLSGLTSGLTATDLTDSELTIKAASISTSPSLFKKGNLTIQNPYVREPLSLKEILSKPLKLKRLSGLDTTSVILYHTHTMEAYCMTEQDRYQVAKKYNETTDNTRNVVAAAAQVQQALLGKDIPTVHDTTIHYEGRVNGVWQDCYYFGKQTLSKAITANPDTQLVIDLHRDGITDPNRDTVRYKETVTGADGKEYAKIMFVVGLDYDAYYNSDPENNPYWQENFKLAMLLIEKLEARVPGISRGISLRREPYNQNQAPNTLLVEMGFDGNLVSEVSLSSQLLGSVLAEVYS